MQRLRGGDQEAAAWLVQRYRPALVRFAGAMLRNEGQAEEAAQEALARLNGSELPTGHPRPWLYRVTRNLCLDILRRRQASPTYAGRLPTGYEPPRKTAGPATRIDRQERNERIRQILDDMPQEYREVLILKHFDGLTREEIAEVLDVSPATIKGRLVRGTQYLREQLQKPTGTTP